MLRLALGALVLAAACDGPSDPDGEATYQASLDAVVDAGAVGAQMEIVDGERRVWRGAGVSDAAVDRAVAEGDRFRIASTTKPFVMSVVDAPP